MHYLATYGELTAMPKIRLTENAVAVARILERENWSHSRIGAVFGVKHSTVTHALRHRKTKLPGCIEAAQSEILATTLARVDRAMMKACAKELRACAAGMDRAATAAATSQSLTSAAKRQGVA